MFAPVRWLFVVIFVASSLCVVRPGLAQLQEPLAAQSKDCLEFEILQQPAAPKNAQNESSEAKIRRALEARVRAKLVNAELGPFCRELAKKFSINVILDREPLEEIDLHEDALLNFSCRDLPVKTALRRMLGKHELTWVICHEVLMITTEEVAQENREIKIYDVADLVTISRGKGEYDLDFEPLIELIVCTVDAVSWAEMGGNGTIKPFEQDRLQILVISQTAEVHEDINKFLSNLRVHLPKKTVDKEAISAERQAAQNHNHQDLPPSARKITSPEETIYRSLDKTIDLNLDHAPLSQFAAQLEKRLGISVKIDDETLEELDLSRDTPVTAHLSGISARSALTLALRPYDLDYLILEDCLMITSSCCSYENQVARIYDVANLVKSLDADLSAPDFEPLIEVITTTVDPELWADFGGNGTIEPFEGGGMRVLVIKQTWAAHYQIEKLLDQLHKVRREGRGRPFPLNYRKKSNAMARNMKTMARLGLSYDHLSQPLFRENVAVKSNPDRDELVRGNNRFALELFSKLRAKAKDQNVFFSPMSISTAMAMAHAGARGETVKEIGHAMHFTLPPRWLYPACGSLLAASQGSSGHELAVANRLWMQKGYRFRDEYVRITRNHFGAEGKILDFVQQPDEAVREINQWTAQATGNRIPRLVTRDKITDDLALVLTNAVYFKGRWREPFEKIDTTRQPFHAPGGPKQVPLMTLEDDSTEYAQIDNPSMQILKKPYKGGDLSMIVLLPADKPGALDNLEAKLTSDNLNKWLQELKDTKVKVYLPKFRLDADYDLKEPFVSLGMRSVFDVADFSGIDGGAPGELFIAWIVHKARVEVDERGTVAAAASGWGMMGGGMMAPKAVPEFRADRPFIFLILDHRTGSILFLGRLSNP